MAGAKHRQKGDRIEREIVAWHERLGVKAQRVPLSGATNYQDAGHDVDVYLFRDECPFVFEVKARKNGDGFRLLERWIENAEGLFLRSNRNKPLVVLSTESYERMVENYNRLTEELERCRQELKKLRLDAISERPEADAGGSNGKTTIWT
jgi:Holliday junction resolvase